MAFPLVYFIAQTTLAFLILGLGVFFIFFTGGSYTDVSSWLYLSDAFLLVLIKFFSVLTLNKFEKINFSLTPTHKIDFWHIWLISFNFMYLYFFYGDIDLKDISVFAISFFIDLLLVLGTNKKTNIFLCSLLLVTPVAIFSNWEAFEMLIFFVSSLLALKFLLKKDFLSLLLGAFFLSCLCFIVKESLQSAVDILKLSILSSLTCLSIFVFRRFYEGKNIN
jgi:hypothetical protein